MDLDLLDDLQGEKGKNVRAGAKFQRRGKSRPVKKNLGAMSTTNTQTSPTADVSEGLSSAVAAMEKAASCDNDRSFGVGDVDPPDHLPSSSAVVLDPVVDGFLPNSTENWQAWFENPAGESADIYIGLDTLDDCFPDSATVLESHIPSSQAAMIDVFGSKDAEHMLADDNANPPDDIPVSISNIHMSSQTEASASQDPLTSFDPIVSTNHNTIDGEDLDTEDGEIDFSSMGLSNAAPSQSTSETLAHEAPTDFVGFSHQEDNIPGKRSAAASKVSRRATGKGALNRCKELASTSNEASVAGRSLRERRKPINDKFIDESMDEVLEYGEDNVSNPVMNEEDNASDGIQKNDEPQEKKGKEKSKKFEGEKNKLSIKRKKYTESSNQAAKAPKKFSHRSRKKVDKALLEIPEDERDFTQIPLRDLILLAEHKEQTVKKAAKTSQAQLQNQRNGNHTEDGIQDGDETTDRAEIDNEEENCRTKESSNLFNCHTHMDKTPRLRWSPQDTELFYEGIRQFGSDLSMILHLFPGKTRHQMKLKYKQEERQHPKKLNEALSNPAQDYSHFNMVIEGLKQKAAEEDQSKCREDSVSLTGEEEMEEELFEADEEAAKSEPVGESGTNENMTAEAAESQSVVETYDETSDDDFFYEYKSEL